MVISSCTSFVMARALGRPVSERRYRKKTLKNKLFFIFFGVMLGPYIKSRGTRGTEMSANADLITMETSMYVQGETI